MATTQYVIADVLAVPAVINEIKRRKGDILAINPEPTEPGKAPQKREVWFFCSKTAREILEAIGCWDESIREPQWFVPDKSKEDDSSSEVR